MYRSELSLRDPEVQLRRGMSGKQTENALKAVGSFTRVQWTEIRFDDGCFIN